MTTTTNFPTEYTTLESAERIFNIRVDSQEAARATRTTPPSKRPAIIHGPNGGYLVVTRGWAINNEHAIIL